MCHGKLCHITRRIATKQRHVSTMLWTSKSVAASMGAKCPCAKRVSKLRNTICAANQALYLLIVLIITRAVYYYIFDKFSIVKFIFLAVSIQIIHDILFYIFFQNIPRGVNNMLDTFKDYANEVSFKAILGDSAMMISASLISSYLATKNLNTNIIVLVVFVYLLPYLLYN